MAAPLNFLRDSGDTAFEAPVRERLRGKYGWTLVELKRKTVACSVFARRSRRISATK